MAEGEEGQKSVRPILESENLDKTLDLADETTQSPNSETSVTFDFEATAEKDPYAGIDFENLPVVEKTEAKHQDDPSAVSNSNGKVVECGQESASATKKENSLSVVQNDDPGTAAAASVFASKSESAETIVSGSTSDGVGGETRTPHTGVTVIADTSKKSTDSSAKVDTGSIFPKYHFFPSTQVSVTPKPTTRAENLDDGFCWCGQCFGNKIVCCKDRRLRGFSDDGCFTEGPAFNNLVREAASEGRNNRSRRFFMYQRISGWIGNYPDYIGKYGEKNARNRTVWPIPTCGELAIKSAYPSDSGDIPVGFNPRRSSRLTGKSSCGDASGEDYEKNKREDESPWNKKKYLRRSCQD